ncbi:MAG: pyridoxal phosphate-dependent aminotransferase [Gemmatimonadota bacterium]|nr:pyridoxal phosphate-dependent aminotransferase [Gemmatimonadota bacterium]
MQFSPNIATLEPSPTLALAARARQLKAQGVPVIDLSAGEPQFPAPDFALRAASDSIAAGMTGYPPTPGLPGLRQAIVSYLGETTRRSGLEPSQVIVGAGVKQVLFNCTYALFGEGDEVIVPAPYWPSYTAIIQLARATPVVVEGTWEDGFLVDADRLDAARTPRTRGLFLNSPSNPTGAVYDRSALASIVEWADRHGVWLLSDEIYRRLGYVDEVPSVFDIDAAGDRVVLLDGMSKAFCMPGLRIGYGVGSPELVARMSDLQGQTTSGAVVSSQVAAAAALSRTAEREEFVADLVARLEALRDEGLERLSRIDALEVRPPDGSIYFYARVRDSSVTSMEIAEGLLADEAVASIPGEPFGSPGYLRLNFAVERKTMLEGIERMKRWFER